MCSQPQKQQDTPPKQVSEDAMLKVTKEVVIKFIEVGRLSPGNFGEIFEEIYASIRRAVKKVHAEQAD